jgi:hypothetical protein
MGNAVWAAFMELDLALQHDLLRELQELLAVPEGSRSISGTRIARAIAALREAADELGHSPSVKDFRRLRFEHPERRWPPESSIRVWLGSGRWNGSLSRAGLEAPSPYRPYFSS